MSPEHGDNGGNHDGQDFILRGADKFSSDLGLPKLNVDELLQARKENIDAPSQSATVATQGARSVAQTQREVLEAGLREAAMLVREFERLGNVDENSELQTEFAKKVLEIVVQGPRRAHRSAGNRSRCGEDHPGPHKGTPRGRPR
jgi:hypothetical protein